MQRKLSRWAEQDKERQFYGLFDLLCDPDWLHLAHDHMAQNAGSKTAGCDGVVMSAFDEDLQGNLKRLHEALRAGAFEACPVRRVCIPKGNGKVRRLGIPMYAAYCISLPTGFGIGDRNHAFARRA
jgi:RNA-directed DNA polymerase